MDITTTIFFGVISGVLTALLLLMSGLFLRKVIVPWYQEIKYQGVDLNGTWSNNEESPDKAKFEMTIKQNAHLIKGEALITGSIIKDGNKLEFNMTGTVWEGYLSLTMKSKDRSRVSFATLLLKVCNGGQQLEGNLSHKSMAEDIVKSGNVLLFRV